MSSMIVAAEFPDRGIMPFTSGFSYMVHLPLSTALSLSKIYSCSFTISLYFAVSLKLQHSESSARHV